MWLIKGCPRCGGDLYEERYLNDHEVRCLQCGHHLDARELAVARARKERRPPAPAIPERFAPLRAA